MKSVTVKTIAVLASTTVLAQPCGGAPTPFRDRALGAAGRPRGDRAERSAALVDVTAFFGGSCCRAWKSSKFQDAGTPIAILQRATGAMIENRQGLVAKPVKFCNLLM